MWGLPSNLLQGTLLNRVEALERAMDALLRAQVTNVTLLYPTQGVTFVESKYTLTPCCPHAVQETAVDQQRQRPASTERQRGCSTCCCIM